VGRRAKSQFLNDGIRLFQKSLAQRRHYAFCARQSDSKGHQNIKKGDWSIANDKVIGYKRVAHNSVPCMQYEWGHIACRDDVVMLL
jgi:hypothetical protein